MSDLAATWQAEAACVGRDVDFFPGRGESTAAAKALCATCPVVGTCLDYAMEHGIKHGVWGGLSERERRPLRKARSQRAAS